MKTRSFIYLFLLNLFLIHCQSAERNQISEKPNFLFIAVDDLRPELNCYGAEWIHSPHIDRLASTGIRFDFAYCQVPVCGASRASLLTGLRPSSTRFLTYDTWAEKDAPGITSLPKYLKDHGYTTISNGKVFHNLNDSKISWSENPWHPIQDQGGDINWRDYQTLENRQIAKEHDGLGPAFELIEGDDSLYFDGKIAKKSLFDLERLKKAGQPFFLAVGFLKPHLPFNAPAKYWEIYNPEEIRMPENPDPPEKAPDASLHNWGELRQYFNIPKEGPLPDSVARKLIQGYYACVSYTDVQIGKLLKKLEELKLDENTVVVLWGDHGWNLGEHGLWCKHCNYETSLRAPLILKVPWLYGNIKSKALVEFIDIYPTLCKLANLDIPDHVLGESLLPYFENPSHPGKSLVYSRFHRGESIKNQKYRYTEWLDDSKNRYADMLYDHEIDIQENKNIADIAELIPVIEGFRKSNRELREKLIE